MKILSLTQGSPAWHAHRRTSLGATTASILAGENPWKCAYDLYVEMVEGKIGLSNDSMRKGIELEDEARTWAENELEVQLFSVTGQHDVFEYMHASFDGLSFDGSTAVEIKCSKKTYDDAVKGKIPAYYMWQMQQQMLIADLKFMYYCCYWDGKGKIIKVDRDAEIVKEIIINADSFYHNHIQTNTPPVSRKAEKQPLNEIREDSKTSVLLNLANREEIVKKIKHLESLKEYLDEQIFSEVKDSCQVGKWKIVKTMIKGTVDYSKIPGLEGIDLDIYRKPSREQWRIS